MIYEQPPVNLPSKNDTLFKFFEKSMTCHFQITSNISSTGHVIMMNKHVALKCTQNVICVCDFITTPFLTMYTLKKKTEFLGSYGNWKTMQWTCSKITTETKLKFLGGHENWKTMEIQII